MKTYARSIRRIWDGEDVPGAKKQRIEQKKAPATTKVVSAAPTPGTSDENIQRAIRETSVAASSSPSRKNSAIFSASDAHTDDTNTPPSSPPPPQVTPPANNTRKPTFNFLKRKREVEANGAYREESEPLVEVVNNSSTSRAASTINTTTQSQPHRPLQPAERKQSHSHNTHHNQTAPKSSHPKPTKTPQTPTFPSLVKKPSTSTTNSNSASTPALHQTTLSLPGAQDTRRTCKECSMSYIASNPDDAALHRMWHDKDSAGVDLGKAFSKGSAMRWAYEVPHIEGIVVVVDRKTSAPARAQVKKVLEVVGKELGSVPIDEATLWSQKDIGRRRKSTVGEDNENQKSDRYKVFLHIKDAKCVGLCLAERITHGRPVVKSSSSAASQEHIELAETTKPAVVGISRIWTSVASRGQGIARNLVDCVMNNFIYGMEIEKEEVAFSQPTEAGGRLARAWFGDAEGQGGWLVYGEE
ncbi:MAG: hypothetical protein Q9227_008098 [Pyrenula ochraceoflavens]